MPPSSSLVRLDIISVESASQTIPKERYADYASLSSPEVPYGEKGSNFLLSSYDQLATIIVRPTLSILLPDKTELQIIGDPLKIKITDEYLDLIPSL